MNRLLIITLIVLMATALVAQEFNTPRVNHLRNRRENINTRKPDMERMRRDESMGMLCRLDLSEQQKEQVRTFQHEHRLEVIDLRAEITKLRLQKEKALRDYDFRNARSLNDRLHNKMGELASKDIELREKIHQVLTTEQREELREAPRSRMMRRDIDDSE